MFPPETGGRDLQEDFIHYAKQKNILVPGAAVTPEIPKVMMGNNFLFIFFVYVSLFSMNANMMGCVLRLHSMMFPPSGTKTKIRQISQP